LLHDWLVLPGGSQEPDGAQATSKKHAPFLHLVGQSAGQVADDSPQSQILSPHEATNLLPSQTVDPEQLFRG
jgi:hypothetical protein